MRTGKLSRDTKVIVGLALTPFLGLALLISLVLYGYFFPGPRPGPNFAREVGFDVRNSEVVMDEDDGHLTAGENFCLAKIPWPRSKKLMARLRQLNGPEIDPDFTPAKMALRASDKRWAPGTVRKYYAGSFHIVLRGDTEYPFMCDFIADLDHSDHVTLFLHAIQFYN